jgi:DNA replication and repair protein RecF
MTVYNLETENFRALESRKLDFSPGVNVVTGANAQGKTTLLEAVYLLTGARSFRTRFDRELIAFDQDEAVVRASLNARGRDQRVELLLSRGKGRRIRQNGVRRSASQLGESLTAVLFCPDDLFLVRGAPALRRRLLDLAIGQLRPGYAALYSEYVRLFDHKTRILRDYREKPSLLEPLDDFSAAMAMASARLIRYRASFAFRLAETAAPIHREFSGGKETLSLRYCTVSGVMDPMAPLSEVLEGVRRRQAELKGAELDAGQCLVGAHKDDLEIRIDGNDARSFASQGQSRTAALSLKLAEREIFLQETGEAPVLLLDDVLSELDPSRQEFVLSRITGGQTFITCCGNEPPCRLEAGKTLHLEKGRAV